MDGDTHIFWKNGSLFREIFVENGTHVQGFLVKSDPLKWHIPNPYVLICEYLPPGVIYKACIRISCIFTGLGIRISCILIGFTKKVSVELKK